MTLHKGGHEVDVFLMEFDGWSHKPFLLFICIPWIPFRSPFSIYSRGQIVPPEHIHEYSNGCFQYVKELLSTPQGSALPHSPMEAQIFPCETDAMLAVRNHKTNIMMMIPLVNGIPQSVLES